MNRGLQKDFGENVAENRGWHWALTSFVVEAWGETEKELEKGTKTTTRFVTEKKCNFPRS